MSTTELIQQRFAELPEPGPSGWEDAAIDTLLGDIQGNILKSHARKHVRLLFFRFSPDGQLAPRRKVLGELADRWVRSAKEQHLAIVAKRDRDANTQTFGQLALTEDGYGVLGLEPRHRFQGHESRAFLAGMARSALIPGANVDPPPRTWDPFFREQSEGRRVHGLLLLADDDESALGHALQSAEAALHPYGETVVEVGRALPGDIEHFGYRDGISQPRFFKRDAAKDQGPGGYDGRAGLSLVLAKDPYSDTTTGYGSYLVYRKLEQDVPRFERWVMQTAEEQNLSPDLVRAYVVGRFRDGTPVISHAQPAGSTDNSFGFDAGSDDRNRCPFHAHIRKSNPREATRFLGVTFDTQDSVHRRRIARRGIPYGDLVSNEGALGKRGLQFMCFQSDIAEQFEVIQRRWIDFEPFPRPGTGDDALIGQAAGVRQDWPTGWGEAKTQAFEPGPFVTLRGGDYFFAPSITFLRGLARG